MRHSVVRLAVSAAMLVVTGGFAAGSVRQPLLTLPGLWTTVRSYSFSGRASSGVGTSNWTYDDGQGNFGNDEVQANTSSTANVHLSGAGALDITALDKGGQWTSGRIQTNAQFAAPAGGELTISASIEQPATSAGPGYWPAFWLLGPGQWPAGGEIDIMEDVNSLSEHSAALHCGNLTQRNPDGTTGPCHEHTGLSSGLRPCGGCQSGFHTYSMTIDRRDSADEQLTWSLDGQQFFSVNESQVGQAVWTEAVDHGFTIVLDLAMGGTYPDALCQCTAPTAQTRSGGTMIVQSITVSEWTPLLGLL
jgi:beta-glucanase (GH16 family)